MLGSETRNVFFQSPDKENTPEEENCYQNTQAKFQQMGQMTFRVFVEMVS